MKLLYTIKEKFDKNTIVSEFKLLKL